MPQTAAYVFVYHQMLVVIAGSVCLLGTWVGMKAGVDMVPISYRGSSAAVTQ